MKEETQVVSMSMLTQLVFQIHPVNNMLQSMENSIPRPDAKIAHGHHAQSEKPAKINSGPSNTRTIMLKTTTALVVSQT